ncbi:MAG TPA: NAD-dependent epimerase/dehydratase family protein [Bacteroidota bacterium]|nr:NAD-dependent epimerase/dehydratase family protein [Bacteroidota bacterium]
MKVLVTGGTGFIGSHLVERLLDRGYEVMCIAKDALNARLLESRGCRVVIGDLNTPGSWEQLLDGVETVYHVAGVTRCRVPAEYYEGNYMATKQVVDTCAAVSPGLRHFVYVSSQTAIGPSLGGFPIGEETPYHPVSDYGKSKMLAELEVLRASDRLPVTIVRPSAVYGPRERDMYDYIRTIKHGLQLLIGFHDKIMSLIHVQDLVNGIMLAGESAVSSGKKYFLGSEVYYSYAEIGSTIARVVHRHPLSIRLPHCLVWSVGAVSTAIGKLSGQQVFLNIEKAREVVQPAWTCSVAKAKRELGFRQNVSLEEGMRQTYNWYVENGWM